MRLVRYAPQERVDLPDITAMSSLVLGEFRRTVRGLIIGPGAATPDYDTFVVRGFEVEAQGVPDATVNVTLDPGGSDPLGFAIGAQDLSSRIDFGQLVGGDDIAGNTEGNAVTVFDFTGQPADTYLLQMRFVYNDGVSDNRLFWDEGTNSEFVAATDTRQLPVIEVGIATSPTSLGDEYIPLAIVVWNGATVSPGDITDVRRMSFEGPPVSALTGGFSDASQATTTFGVGDFDRSTDRRTDGLNEVYPVLRALARQIQDIKGQNNSGLYDWYSRPVGPVDPGAALATEQTRTLRTLDTVTFTVGDGTTTFGDFNGAAGLENCLQHIEDMAANVPANVEIVCRSRGTTAFTFNITTAHTMNAGLEKLTIDFQGHEVAISNPASTDAVSLPGGDLEVRNVSAGTTANNATFFRTDDLRRLILRNVTLTGDITASADPVVEGGVGSIIERCFLDGWIDFTNPNRTLAANILHERIATVQHSELNCLSVRSRDASGSAAPVHVSHCIFRQTTDHCYGQLGAIDLGNNSYSKVDHCTIIFRGEGGSGIRAEAFFDGGTLSFIRADELHISNNYFAHSDVATTTPGNHAVQLQLSNDTTVADNVFSIDDPETGALGLVGTDTMRSVTITGNHFDGHGQTRTDAQASAIYCLRGDDVTIANNTFRDWAFRRAIHWATNILDVYAISGNVFRDCPTAIDLASGGATLTEISVTGNTFRNGSSSNFVDLGTQDRCSVVGNNFFLGAGPGFAVLAGASGTHIVSGNRIHTATLSTGGAVLWGFSGGGGPTNLNYVT